MDQLAAVTNLLAAGQACAAVAPYLAGARLVAVPKPAGGIRPIAIGETLRRLVGKCLMSTVRDDARNHFWPEQAGVTVPAGAECLVHAVRGWLRRHEDAQDRVLVKLDFANAFNLVSRQAFLDACAAEFLASLAGSAGAIMRLLTCSLGTPCSNPAEASSRGIL